MVLETMLRRLSGTEQFRFEHGHRMELGTQKKKVVCTNFRGVGIPGSET